MDIPLPLCSHPYQPATVSQLTCPASPHDSLGMEHTENTKSSSSSIGAPVSVAGGMCLPSQCPAKATPAGINILPFKHHVTLLLL